MHGLPWTSNKSNYGYLILVVGKINAVTETFFIPHSFFSYQAS